MPRWSITAVDNNGALDAALESETNAVLLTLANASETVESLRAVAAAAAPRVRERNKQALVTVNHPRTRLLRDDIGALPIALLDGVLLPHAVEPQDVRDLAVVLREFELSNGVEPGSVAILPVIDTARGLLRAAEIAAAAPRVAGLVFDSGAYAADVGARDESRGERLAYARGFVVAAAHAADGEPVVRGGDLELPYLAQCGFAGAIVSNATAAAAANAAFGPLPADKDRARRIVEAYDAAHTGGDWVGRSGTVIADAHAARAARRLLGE